MSSLGCAPDVNCLKICTNSVNKSLKFEFLSVFTSVLFIGALLANHDGIFISLQGHCSRNK